MRRFRSPDLPPLPAPARIVLDFLLPDGDYADLYAFHALGYRDILESRGRKAARRWLGAQILKGAPALVRAKISGEFVMFMNYLKTALRIILRHRGFSFINISGLTVGLASCLLSAGWVDYQLRVDRHHRNAEEIYQVVIQWREGDQVQWARVTPPPLAGALKAEFPEIRDALTFESETGLLVECGDRRFLEKVGFAGPELFSIFTVPLVKGNPETAFSDPASLIIGEETARKYFAHGDPLGQTLVLNGRRTYRVAAVMKDIPENSVLHCGLIVPYRELRPLLDKGGADNWKEYGSATYIRMDKAGDPKRLLKKLDAYLKEKRGEDNIRLALQPLTQVHLYALGGGGAIVYVYIFSALAAFVLLLAGVNFTNLTTARSATRLREIGIRKTVGADRRKLFLQFLSEAVLMAFASAFFAFFLAGILAGPLKRLTGIPGGESFLNLRMMPQFLAAALLTGILAGSYPAAVLASFRPAGMLKDRHQGGSPAFRKILVVFQFAVSITLIICFLIISRQMDFISRSPLGFDRNQVVYIPLNTDLRPQLDTLRAELRKSPRVLQASGTSSYLGRSQKFSTETIHWKGKNPEIRLNLNLISVDPEFAETFRLEMADGRFFSREYPSDGENFVLNETAVRDMGLQSPVGQEFSMWENRGRIIGIVKDFNFLPLHQEVQPLGLIMRPEWHDFMAVKIAPGDIPGALAHIESVFKRLSPRYPYEYHFLDEILDAQYRIEAQSRRLFQAAVVLAVFISCLGLLGLASFMTEKRAKEISIRKVLGAPVSGIAALLGREFLLWVAAANFIAWPAAYIVGRKWLDSFAFRTRIGWGAFVFSAAAALLIALGTISVQTIKAARAHPAEVLRR